MKILNGPPNKKKYKKWASGSLAIGTGNVISVSGINFEPEIIIVNDRWDTSYLYFKGHTGSVIYMCGAGQYFSISVINGAFTISAFSVDTPGNNVSWMAIG